MEKYARIARINKTLPATSGDTSCATHLVKNKTRLRHRDLSKTERYVHLTIADLMDAHRQRHPREREKEIES